MKICRQKLLVLLQGLVLIALSACGGGGGADPQPTAATGGDLKLLAANVADQAVGVPTNQTFLLSFDAELDANGMAPQVELTDGQSRVPIVADVFGGGLRIRAAQDFRMRTDYTLTVRAGLKARSGSVLRTDIVRRFKTILLDGRNTVVHPGNFALNNFQGDRTFRVADVNGDLRPDIVQIGGDAALMDEANSFAINVFLQNADHSFTRTQNLLVRESQHLFAIIKGDIAVADVDLDGRPEILVSVLRPLPGLNGIVLLKQSAQGLYEVGGFLATNFAHRLFVADIDRDGRVDVLAFGQGVNMTDGPDRCGMVAVLSSPGGPQLQPSTVLPCERYEAVLDNLDAPGVPHLVLIRRNTTVPAESLASRLRIYRLDAQGVPTLDGALMRAAENLGSGLGDCNGLMLLDVNADGLRDLLFRRCQVDDRTSTTVVYTRNAGSAYREWTRQSFGGFAYLLADMDRDGLDDVMVVYQDFLAGSFIGGGFASRTGGFEWSNLVPVDVFDTTTQETTAVADLDGDGLPDIVMDSYNTGLSVLFQRRR